MKTTKTLKTIISMVLVACIMLTGNTITANAANTVISNPYGDKIDGVENVYYMNGKTISMKIGDEKRIDLQKDYGSYSIDLTDDFELSSSDESVIQIEKRYWSEDVNIIACFLLKVKKSGTAVITCVNDWKGETVTFTVEVKGATAKQKACSKHVWKTTKKASCRRAGVKVCKKCKLTKSIPQKQHQWKTYKVTKTVFDEYEVFMCNGCAHEDPAVKYEHDHAREFGVCDKLCGMEFSERDYGSREAALTALNVHAGKCRHVISVASRIANDNPHKVKVTVTECKTCGITPEEAERR